MTIKLSTINQLVEAIFEEASGEEHKKMLANEVVIYAKLFMLAEAHGIERALDYYFGGHSEDEYEEFRTTCIMEGGEK